MPATYKILSNILLSRLIPYAKETIGDHQCGFRRNRSTIEHIFCIHQILEKKWEYNEEVHQLFIDFKKPYDSVRREVLYKILIEFGILRKLVRLIKMSLTETYSRVRVVENVSDRFPIRNGLKQGDALSPLLFNFALEFAIRKVQDRTLKFIMGLFFRTGFCSSDKRPHSGLFLRDLRWNSVTTIWGGAD